MERTMSKKYEAAAVKILAYVGGPENVNTLRHCQTRLCFSLKDQSKVDQKSLEAMPEVLKIVPTEGMYQIVIGTDVADCYEELAKLLPEAPGAAASKEDQPKKSVVIPIILVIFVQSWVEKLLNRWIPKAVNLVLVPMLTFLIMGTLALSVLGPIGNFLGGYLAQFFTFLSENAAWAPAFLIGAFLPPMVMFGLHNGVAPLGVMQMSQLGYDSIFGPGCVCSNIAQGTAGLVVALRTKVSRERQLATSTGVTALMGITEPVLYGINLPKKYPLIAAMIGGGCGGLYAGLTHTHRFATGSSGLPAVLLYIGDDSMRYFINILIALGITILVTAIVTWFLSLRFEKKSGEPSVEVPAGTVGSPVNGTVIPMEQIPDETFAAGVLGQGVGVQPKEGAVCAPFTGTVSQVADTGHAIGLTSDDGMELLIHVGVDTVDMNGKGFSPKVKVGDDVQAGQLLMTFDRKAIKAAGHPDVVVVMLTNADEYPNVKLAPAGETRVGSEILRVK